jgi:hypothetical protein
MSGSAMVDRGSIDDELVEDIARAKATARRGEGCASACSIATNASVMLSASKRGGIYSSCDKSAACFCELTRAEHFSMIAAADSIQLRRRISVHRKILVVPAEARAFSKVGRVLVMCLTAAMLKRRFLK